MHTQRFICNCKWAKKIRTPLLDIHFFRFLLLSLSSHAIPKADVLAITFLPDEPVACYYPVVLTKGMTPKLPRRSGMGQRAQRAEAAEWRTQDGFDWGMLRAGCRKNNTKSLLWKCFLIWSLKFENDCNPSSDMPQLHLHLAGWQIQIFQEHCSMSKWLGYQVGRVRLFHHLSNSIASFIRKRQKVCFEHLPYQKDSIEFMFFSSLMSWPWKFTVPFPLEEHPWFPWLPSRVARLVEFVEDRRVSPYLWGQHGWEGRAYIYRSNIEEVHSIKRPLFVSEEDLLKPFIELQQLGRCIWRIRRWYKQHLLYTRRS